MSFGNIINLIFFTFILKLFALVEGLIILFHNLQQSNSQNLARYLRIEVLFRVVSEQTGNSMSRVNKHGSSVCSECWNFFFS